MISSWGGSLRRRAGLAVAAMVAAGSLAGCATLGASLESPQLSLVGIRFQGVSFFEQQLQVRLRVKNPNDIALPVRGIDVAFELAGEHFADGVSAQAFEVPARGEAEFDMNVTANAATAVLRILDKGGGRRPESLDYRIKGKLRTSLGLLRSVPFDEKGTIDVGSMARGRVGGG